MTNPFTSYLRCNTCVDFSKTGLKIREDVLNVDERPFQNKHVGSMVSADVNRNPTSTIILLNRHPAHLGPFVLDVLVEFGKGVADGHLKDSMICKIQSSITNTAIIISWVPKQTPKWLHRRLRVTDITASPTTSRSPRSTSMTFTRDGSLLYAQPIRTCRHPSPNLLQRRSKRLTESQKIRGVKPLGYTPKGFPPRSGG